MELQGRNLSESMQGEDVGVLIAELLQLGYDISEEERSSSRFGRDTKSAVEDFQRNHNIPIGAVDARTARLINLAVHSGQREPQEYIVQGTVRTRPGHVVPDLVIRAFDKDLRSEELLGEAATSIDGTFEITYTSKQFRKAEARTADLVVRAFKSTGAQVAQSDVLFNAPFTATVDLIVSSLEDVELSEVEKLASLLGPVLDGATLTELDDDDVSFLSAELAIDRRRIEFLAVSARHGLETEIQMEAFYGWARKGLPLALPELLTSPWSSLRAELESAINERLVPRSLRASFDAIEKQLTEVRFDHGFVESHEFLGQLISEDTRKPISDVLVRAVDRVGESEPSEVAYDRTDQHGRFMIVYSMSVDPARGPGRDRAGVMRLELHIEDDEGNELALAKVDARPGDKRMRTVPIAARRASRLEERSIEVVASELGIQIPTRLLSYLRGQNVRTLANIRRGRGLRSLGRGQLQGGQEVISVLQGHSNLSVLSDNLGHNDLLLKKGFDSVLAIAEKPRSEFINIVRGELTDSDALQIHLKAEAQQRGLWNTIAGERAGFGTDMTSLTGVVDSPEGDEAGEESIAAVLSPACVCDDCHAVSPSAYLAELIGYTLGHVAVDDNPISVEWLSEAFHQRFAELPTSCDEAATVVLQVRVCVEVLRSYIRVIQSTLPVPQIEALADGVRDYLQKTYFGLLNNLGSSYEEMRLAQKR